MAGLDPAIYRADGKMDGRLKGGHDKLDWIRFPSDQRCGNIRTGFGLGPTLKFVVLMPLVLLAATTGAQAAAPLTLRIKADGPQIEFYHRGRKLSDSRLEQLCANARRQKIDIEFRRDKMTRDNALAAILKEAQCLGATHSGLTKIDREPEPKSGSHKRAKPRHKAKARR